MNRFFSNDDKELHAKADELAQTDNRHRIYAASEYENALKLMKQRYGDESSLCLCRLWRSRCNYKCEYRYRGGGWMDHPRMFRNDKGELTFIGQPYSLQIEHMKELIELAEKHNLSIRINANESEWFPGATMAVIVQRKSTR